MSALSEKVAIALYAKLNVSGVTTLATGGIWQDKAPAGIAMPYVVFSRFAPGSVVRALKQTLIAEDDEWLVKAIVEQGTSATLSPQALLADILIAAETAIGNSLSISGQNVWLVERVADIPSFVEELGDRLIYHAGFRLRVVVN